MFPDFIIVTFPYLPQNHKDWIRHYNMRIRHVIGILVKLNRLGRRLIERIIINMIKQIMKLGGMSMGITLKCHHNPLVKYPGRRMALTNNTTLLPFRVIILPGFMTDRMNLIFTLRDGLRHVMMMTVRLNVLRTFQPFLGWNVGIITLFRIGGVLPIVQVQKGGLAASNLIGLPRRHLCLQSRIVHQITTRLYRRQIV